MRSLRTLIRFAVTTTALIALAVRAHAILDTNSNNLSDVWEKAYNNGTLPVPAMNATDDPDQDGWDNATECAAGTNPFLAEAPALRNSLTVFPSAIPDIHYLTATTRYGKSYQIQVTQDLAIWQDQGAPYLGNGRQMEDIVQAVLGNGQPAPSVFWRLGVTDIDTDGDGLTDWEESVLKTNPNSQDSDGDGLSDLVELRGRTASGVSFSPTDPLDPDSDGVTNLSEYLNNTDPNDPNSDGDSTNDGGEIAQGSDPNNSGDQGLPPADSPENISFHVYGDYTQWEATVTGKGPDDHRVRRFRMSAPGGSVTQSVGLHPGNTYEFALKYLSTLPDQRVPWYCWEASIAGQTDPAFALAGKWLVDNSSALLADHSHSQGENKVKEKKPVTLAPVSLDVYPPEPTEEDIAAAGDDIWEVETFQIAADEPEIWIPATVYVAGRDGDGNQTLIPAEDGTVVSWSIVTAESAAGGALSGTTSATENGMASIKLTTSTVQKARFKVKAEVATLRYRPTPTAAVTELSLPGGAVTTRTQFFEVVPGDAIAITAAQTRTTMPADGKSESRVTVTLKDSTGTFAARGTDVQWRLKGSGGLIIHDHVLASEDGVVEATVVAGTIIGQQVLTVEADGAVLNIPIQNSAVSVTSLTAAYPSLDLNQRQTTQLTLTTTGVADGAPVSWQTSKGEIISADATVTGNTATATLLATATTTGEALVNATLGDAITSCRVAFTSSALASVSVDNPVLAFDAGANGTESLPMADGTARSVDYFVNTPVHLSAPGHGGEWATIALGGSHTLTAERFKFDTATNNLSGSEDGLVNATLANGAAIAPSPLPGAFGLGVLDLPDPAATAGIPHIPALSLTSGSDLDFWLLPNIAAGTVLTKDGEYRIFFTLDGKLSCSFGPTGAQTTVTSASVLTTDRWHHISMSVASGRLTLTVDAGTAGVAWNGSFPSTTAPLVIGGYDGMFDDLQWRHLQTGLVGVTLSAQGLDAQNRIQLDANGKADFVMASAPAGGAAPPHGQAASVEVQVGGQTAKVPQAAQITTKGSAVIITAIAGRTAVLGSDVTNQTDRAQLASNLLREEMAIAERTGALPKDLGGDAKDRGETGYLIALYMEESVDIAGIVHSIISVSAQGLPEEVGNILNMMLAEMMIEASKRHSTDNFANYIMRNYSELLQCMRALSTGDIQSFARLAGVADGEVGFGNVAATTQQLGEGPVTRLIKDAGTGLAGGYDLLVYLAAHLGVELASAEELSAEAKELQRSLLAGLAAKELKNQLQKAFLKLKHHQRIEGSRGALNTIVGEAGEPAAMIRISRKGNKNIVAMRNASNQGIDYVFRDKQGHVVFVEVKAHEGVAPPRLSKNQRKSREFCEDRLRKLGGSDGDPLYQNVPEELRQHARELLEEIDPKKGNKPFRAIVINVDNALSPNPIVSYYEWAHGLGAVIPNPMTL